MFSNDERTAIRVRILEMAKSDARITGGAVTGSASVGQEDRWSDVDLAFGVKGDSNVAPVLADFTRTMYDDHEAVHHLDVFSGSWIYRVFFLRSTLQVDIAVVEESAFGARAPTFRLVFGVEKTVQPALRPPPQELIGWGWLNALHVRSAIERGRVWQAEHFIRGLRDQVVALACLRFDLPVREGRGVDQLSSEIKERYEATLVRSLDRWELKRAFGAVVENFLDEVRFIDVALKARLEMPLMQMVKGETK